MKKLILIGCLLITILLLSSEIFDSSDHETAISEKVEAAVDTVPKLEQIKVSPQSNPNKDEIINQANVLIDESNWEDQFGCYNILVEGENDCEYSFLNARSQAEAEWMKRQGYPSRNLLKMASDQSLLNDFNELLDKKYVPALTVASILAMKNGNNKAGRHYALSAKVHSNQSLSFPHRLYAEAYLGSELDGRRATAATHYYIAGLLGDNQARSIVHGLAQGDTIFLEHAMRRANEMISRNFVLPLDEIPKDPRPEGFGGG